MWKRENLLFKGRAFGAELNLIFSFTNLYQTRATKWHAAGYFGVGYHQYNSALYERLADGSEYAFDDANFALILQEIVKTKQVLFIYRHNLGLKED